MSVWQSVGLRSFCFINAPLWLRFAGAGFGRALRVWHLGGVPIWANFQNMPDDKTFDTYPWGPKYSHTGGLALGIVVMIRIPVPGPLGLQSGKSLRLLGPLSISVSASVSTSASIGFAYK